MHAYAGNALPRPGNGLADLHVILAQAVSADDGGLGARVRQMAELAGEGRYPSGPYLPALSRGFVAFEQGNFPAVIDALEPFASESERIGGSRGRGAASAGRGQVQPWTEMRSAMAGAAASTMISNSP